MKNLLVSEYPPMNDLKVIASLGNTFLLIDITDGLETKDPRKMGYVWDSRAERLSGPERIQVIAKFIEFEDDDRNHIPNYPYFGERDDDDNRGATGEVRQKYLDEIDEFMDGGGLDYKNPREPEKKMLKVLWKADFDETEHPRNKGGEFAPKGEGSKGGAKEEKKPMTLGGSSLGSFGGSYGGRPGTGAVAPRAGGEAYRMRREEKPEPEPPDERFEPLPDFKHTEINSDKIKEIDPHEAEPTWANPVGKSRYGGVIMSEDGKKVLLREPTGHFDGYAWTFSKGTPDPGDHPVDTAIREVGEETGHNGSIVGFVPGKFSSGNSTTYYFLMHSKGENPEEMDDETNDTRWVTEDEAKELINQSTNYMGKKRDLATLKAAFKYDNALRSGHADNKKLMQAIDDKKIDGKDIEWNPSKYAEPDIPLPPDAEPYNVKDARYKAFDYDKEKSEALGGRQSKRKAHSFLIRSGAVKEASKFKYSSGKSAKDFIDEVISKGFTHVGAEIKDAKHVVLLSDDKGHTYSFNNKPETRYLRTLFNIGDFSGDYSRFDKPQEPPPPPPPAPKKPKLPPPPPMFPPDDWGTPTRYGSGGKSPSGDKGTGGFAGKVIGVFKKAIGDFDETKHPRGKGGEFAPKGEGGTGGGHDLGRKTPKRMHLGGGRFEEAKKPTEEVKPETKEPEPAKEPEPVKEPVKPAVSAKFIGFDEAGERSALFDGIKTKPGITRDQATRFFARNNAVKDAARMMYSDHTTAKSVIDGYVSRGFEHNRKKIGVATVSTLSSPDGKEEYVFKKPEETAYLQTIFNEGNYAKNYDASGAGKPDTDSPKVEEKKPASEPEKPKEESRPAPVHPFIKDEEVLKNAKFTNKRKIGTGITSPDVADVVGDGKAVIKRKPEWDSFGTPQTEYAVYDLSKELGFNTVPPTVLHPDGSSVMKFMPNCISGTVPGGTVGDKALDTFSKIAVMDIVTGNTDRKEWNWLYDTDKNDFYQIDNGYSFILPVRTPREMAPETGRPIRNFSVDSCCEYAENTMDRVFHRVLGGSGRFTIKKEHVDAVKNMVKSGKHKEFLAKHFSGKMLASAIEQMEAGVERLDNLQYGRIA